MSPNPIARRRSLELHEVDQYRRAWCRYDIECASRMADVGAKSFSCNQCCAYAFDAEARAKMIEAAQRYLEDGAEAISDTRSDVSETREQISPPFGNGGETSCSREISQTSRPVCETSAHDKISASNEDEAETESGEAE